MHIPECRNMTPSVELVLNQAYLVGLKLNCLASFASLKLNYCFCFTSLKLNCIFGYLTMLGLIDLLILG